MSRRLPRHLGQISYSVFCVHLVVLHFVMWVTPYDLFVGTNGPQVLGLTLLITLPLAELLYRLVEMPAMRLRGLGRPAGDTASTTARTTAS
jgi:peptidoglycan/LPS O-acetylase OafA/YrhL